MISGYLEDLRRALDGMEILDGAGKALSLDAGSSAAVEMIREAKTAGRTAFVVGNGGSAAIASHMQNDFCKAVGMRSLVFTEQPLLTAYTNDDGYATAYESMLKLWATASDLLVAISSSGRSENILRAARAARAVGCGVITFSGFAADNPLRSLGELNFYVPSHSYGHVEIIHALLAQFLTDALKG